MRKLLFIICTNFFSSIFCYSQKNEIIRFKGEGITEFLKKVGYKYPAFTGGKMYYKDGSTGRGLMNFNLIFQEIQFLNSDGDTLAIADVDSIKFIAIKSDTFYYRKGYYQKLGGVSEAGPFVKQTLKFVDEQRFGPNDKVSGATKIVSIDKNSDFFEHQLGVNAEVIFAKRSAYFFIDKGKFFELNRKNIDNHFGKKIPGLEKYFADHKTDMSSEQDIIKLFSFLNSGS